MSLAAKLGICQWFHYQAYDDVERAIQELRALGVRHLRTGISWADFHRPKGKQWYDWQMAHLADFEVLLSGNACAGPPRNLEHYAQFISQVITTYGHQFAELELWNEPNSKFKWDFQRFDPDWSKFGHMVRLAASTAHAMKKRTVLGGMMPVDHHWLDLIDGYEALQHIDVVAIHGFPGMWWSDAPNWDWHTHWHGWAAKIQSLARTSAQRPVWITETGLASWANTTPRAQLYEAQVRRLEEAARAPVERVYWYSLIDLDPRRAAIEGYHVDEHEYHMGLLTYDGQRKASWELMQRLLGSGPTNKPQSKRTMAGLAE